jgi:hypothetical protein
VGKGGKELFYRSGDKTMAVDVATEPTFTAGTPKVLFEGRYVRQPGPGPNYSVTPDSQRFVMIKVADEALQANNQIIVVVN